MTSKIANIQILKPLLEDFLKQIHKKSKCTSLAIRLQQEGDFPYCLYTGFPEFFVQKENTIAKRNQKNEIITDAKGEPILECMCGNIIRRRFNPKYPYFTKEGAFWTNSTTQLLESFTEQEKQEIGNTRNTCHDYGYESVALIPIHANDEIIGLIQLNDQVENMFTPEKIAEYQVLADHIGKIILDITQFYEKIAN